MARRSERFAFGTIHLDTNDALVAFARQGSGPVREVLRDALIDMALRLWHAKLLPAHFSGRAMSKYPEAYAPRSKTYQLRKARRRGTTAPWVWSGETRRITLHNVPTIRERQTARTLRIVVHLPFVRKMNFWRKRSAARHDFDRAMTITDADDQARIAAHVAEQVALRLSAAYERHAGRSPAALLAPQ